MMESKDRAGSLRTNRNVYPEKDFGGTRCVGVRGSFVVCSRDDENARTAILGPSRSRPHANGDHPHHVMTLG